MSKISLASVLLRFHHKMSNEEMWTLFSWWCDMPVPRLKLMKETIFLQEEDVEELLLVAQKRSWGISLTYALGWRPFYGRRFLVNSDVLVPRQETEELVEHILRRHASESVAPVLVDCGTGSGCIPITLSLEAQWGAVHAWDVSEKALAVARHNAQKLGSESGLDNDRGESHRRVQFHHGDIRDDAWGDWLCEVLGNLKDRQNCLLAGNLPYIPTDEMTGLDADVQQEPALALDGGLHGTAIMKPWLLQIKRATTQTNTQGRVVAYLEGDPDNVDDLTSWCGQQGLGISWREDALGQLRFCDITFEERIHD